MNGDADELEPGAAGDTGGAGVGERRLRAVVGPLGDENEPAPTVRLLREFKGLTVADLWRDEVLERLPGQVLSALDYIHRGDFEAAERALPGQFGRVLEGPGRAPRGRWGAAVLVTVLAVVAASWLATSLFAWLGG